MRKKMNLKRAILLVAHRYGQRGFAAQSLSEAQECLSKLVALRTVAEETGDWDLAEAIDGCGYGDIRMRIDTLKLLGR